MNPGSGGFRPRPPPRGLGHSVTPHRAARPPHQQAPLPPCPTQPGPPCVRSGGGQGRARPARCGGPRAATPPRPAPTPHGSRAGEHGEAAGSRPALPQKVRDRGRPPKAYLLPAGRSTAGTSRARPQLREPSEDPSSRPCATSTPPLSAYRLPAPPSSPRPSPPTDLSVASTAGLAPPRPAAGPVPVVPAGSAGRVWRLLGPDRGCSGNSGAAAEQREGTLEILGLEWRLGEEGAQRETAASDVSDPKLTVSGAHYSSVLNTVTCSCTHSCVKGTGRRSHVIAARFKHLTQNSAFHSYFTNQLEERK